MLGLIGDLLAEVVALAENLPANADNVLGVAVVLGEDERLGHERATGKERGENRVLVRLEDGADLRGDDHRAVKFVGGVGEIVVEVLLAEVARGAGAFVHDEAFFDLASLGRDLGLDAVNVVADVDAVGHGPLVAVFHDEVLVEESDGLLGRGGGQADEETVEVFEHLPPQVVDGAVALVGDDEVERLNGDGGVVGDILGPRVGGGEFGSGVLVQILGQFLATQERVKPLDGADRDAGNVVQLAGGEVLDVVKFGELPASVGRNEVVELLLGLPPEVGAVHEEEHTLGFGVLDEPVSLRASGERLAGAGGHLDERTRAVLRERLFELGYGLHLTGAHPGIRQRVCEGHLRQSGAEGVRFSQPSGEGFRPVEGEDAPGARVGVALVAEEGFHAGGLVEKRQRAGDLSAKRAGQIFSVVTRLLGDTRESNACFLRLDYTCRFPVHEKQVIGNTADKRHFAYSDSATGTQIQLFVILHNPPAMHQKGINLLAGECFRQHTGCDHGGVAGDLTYSTARGSVKHSLRKFATLS